MIVVPGPASQELGKKIAEKLGVKAYPINHRIFPDGESYIRYDISVKNETVIIVQTNAPDNDRKILQLLIMSKAAKNLGAKRIIAVVPYLAYARQDKQFLDGEAIAFEIILDIFESVGINDLIVIDLHSEGVLKEIQIKYQMKVHSLSAIAVIAEYLKKNGYDGAFSLSPDLGRKDVVTHASTIIGGGFAYFEKVRDRYTGETLMKIKGINVNGKKAIVFDDIISSGGTMAKAIKELKAQGATKVVAACTHLLLTPGAEEKLIDAGADIIIGTDTIKSKYGRITVASMVADYLKCMLEP